MSARRRRRTFAEAEEQPHGDERWMASYLDMVTVLMCMFIVLFAMSTVDQNKFEQLRNSLATGFGVVDVGSVDTAKGVVVPAEKANDQAEGFTDLDLAMKEVTDLTALRNKISAGLAQQGLDGTVSFQITERGLIVRLTSSETFFQPDKADLTPQADRILNVIAPVLAPTPYQVSVEGHAARVPIPDPYPSYWEMSVERSTKVLRYLVEQGGLAPERMMAAGFGASRPSGTGNTPEDLAMDRRVDIVVLSSEPEKVRALIPEVLAHAGTPIVPAPAG